MGNLPTYWAWGAGLEASVPVADKVRAGVVVLGQRRDFVDNSAVPFNSQNSGNNGTVAANIRRRSDARIWKRRWAATTRATSR